MYTTYWNLNTRPFETFVDPQFYYPSEIHQAALLKLRYAIENRRGAALLAGAAGLGKTMLVQALNSQLPDSLGPLVHIKFPQMSPGELLAHIADKVSGQKSDELKVDSSLHRIETTLEKHRQGGRHVILVIDEAHLLSGTAAMETVRLLLNFETSWTLLLSGQPSLLPSLERFPQLDERLGVKCLLRRFSADETVSYISHRLHAAGATHPIFDQESMEAVHQLTEGIPRRINRLCDLALLIGFAEEHNSIRPDHIHAVAEELVAGIAIEQKAA